MKMILSTEFKKHEMGPRQATLQRKALSSDATQQQVFLMRLSHPVLSHQGFFHRNPEW